MARWPSERLGSVLTLLSWRRDPFANRPDVIGQSNPTHTRTLLAKNRLNKSNLLAIPCNNSFAARESQNVEWKESWRDEHLKWICGLLTGLI